MREFFIVGAIDPTIITTLEPPDSIVAFVAAVPHYFVGKTMAIIQQEENRETFYVLLSSDNGFIVFGTYPSYDAAFQSAINNLRPITNNLSMPPSSAYQ